MNVKRAVTAGVIGTAAMTMLMLMAPLMGMPPMNIGGMLGGFLGVGEPAGWAMHVVIGVVLALGYALVLAARLPSPTALGGATYGFLVFLMAQLVVMPMMGAGVFSGGHVGMIAGSLMGHLIYGAVVGAVYSAAPRILERTA